MADPSRRMTTEPVVEDISGLHKAAVLLVSVNPEVAAKIVSQLDRETAEVVSLEIARLKQITKEERESIFNEFFTLNLARQYVEQGGLEYARAILERSFSRDACEEILKVVEKAVQESPFAFLGKADSENLLTFIQDEHPQTIALILSHVSPKQASELLKGLPPTKQLEVVKRISTMERTSPEVLKQVEDILVTRLASIVSQRFEKAGGVGTVAEILNLTDRTTERTILESLEEESPELVDRIRKLMFVFEDIILVNDKGIQNVLKEVDQEQLALALKTASEGLKDKIFKNMSQRSAELVKEDMEYMGPVRIADVEAAQAQIVEIVRRLEESGDVIIQGRGSEGEIVV